MFETRYRRAHLWLIAVVIGLAACSDPDSDVLEEATRQQAEGAHEEAERLLGEYLAEHPDDAEASFRRGLSLIALGRGSEAVFPLRKALASPELGKQAGVVLASTLLKTHNFDAAIEAADGVLALESDNESALVTRARAAIGANKPELAIASIDALANAKPGDLLPLSLRAEALGLISGKLTESEALYQQLEDSEWGADELGPGRACLTRAKLVFERGKDPKRAGELALDCADKYAEQPQVVLGTATLLDLLDRSAEGTELVRKRLDEEPSSIELRAGLAQRLVVEDKFAEAEELVVAEAEKRNTAAGWSALAMLRRRLGNLDGALVAVDHAIAVASGEEKEELHTDRADLLLDLGRAEEAEAALDDIESSVFRDIIEGRLADANGDLPLALEKYSAALELWPDNWSLRVRAARAAYETGDPQRALVELREVTRHAPKETDAALQMAQIHLSRGELQDAYAFAWRHIEERGATGPEGHLVAARAAAAAQRGQEAGRTLEDLGRRAEGQFVAIALAEHARIMAASSDAKQALAALDAGIARAKLDLTLPQNAVALRQSAMLAFELEGADAALSRVASVLAKTRGRADLLALRAVLLANAARFEEARAAADQALAASADDPLAHIALGLAQRGSGDPKGAVVHFDRALALDPTLSEAAYLAAQSLVASGDLAGGKQRLEHLVRVFPDHAGALNDLAWILAERGEDLPRAAQLAEQATRLGGRAEMLDTFGYVRLKQERFDEAAKAFRLSLAKNAGYATARYHLALALDRSGDRDGAKRELQLALAGQTFPEADAARTELARLEGAAARLR